MRRWTLEYRGNSLGVIEEIGADFPSVSGYLSREAGWESAWPEVVRRYVEYSLEATALLENPEDWPAYTKLVDAHEREHDALIESRDWALRNEAGEVERILIPIFHDDDTISWRYDFRP